MNKNDVIEQCENAMFEAGVDGATIESLIDSALADTEEKSEEQAIERLLKDTVEQLNLYAPEVEEITFSYEMEGGKATITMETDEIDPIPYQDGAILDMKEQIEEQNEKDDVEYDF